MSERMLKEVLHIAARQTETRAALDYKIIYTQNRGCGSLSRATGQSRWLRAFLKARKRADNSGNTWRHTAVTTTPHQPLTGLRYMRSCQI